jgi:hypothetical protein
MTYQHKGLAEGRWKEFGLPEQMANIGSEVSRALNWRTKGDEELSRKAALRSLELLEMSLDSARVPSHIKELARLREALVDYFFCSNEFASSEALWRSYFDHFAVLARRK